MLFKGISAEEFKKVFDELLSLFKRTVKTAAVDLHELAHRAMETHFAYPSEPLPLLVKKILAEFSCNLANDEVELSTEDTNTDEFSRAEASLDLARLYLLVEKYLSDEDKELFQSINLTDEQVERLGIKVRRVLDATTGSKKYLYKIRGGRSQKLTWQAFFNKHQSPVVNASGDRRFGQRTSH